MPRRPIIAANWKMNKTHLEAIQAVQRLSYLLDAKDAEQNEVVVCPPFTALRSIQVLIESDRLPYGLGAQNVYWESEGAFTGEISTAMLSALACSYVIVGHSERRWVLGETDAEVAKKVKAVLRADMTPIVCVGEKLDDRDAGRTDEVVVGQVKAALSGAEVAKPERLVVAYEPVWAIGTGRNANPADAGEVIALIRSTLGSLFSSQLADAVRIQYGGSVKPGNIREFMAHPEIDGALVGGASLDPEDFALIVKH
jgi:triosephosphate isomerase